MHKLMLGVVVALVAACGSKEKDTASPPAATATVPAAPTGSGSGGSGSATVSTDTLAAAGSGSGSATAAGVPPAPPAPADAGAAAGSGSDSFDFDKLSHEEQMKFMRTQVVPKMKTVFQDFDKDKYKNFGCKTCHGKDPQKSKYKMPNPELPALDFEALKAGKQKPKVAEWMGKVVKPEMAKLLHQPEYSEANPKGFGCLECHTQKK